MTLLALTWEHRLLPGPGLQLWCPGTAGGARKSSLFLLLGCASLLSAIFSDGWSCHHLRDLQPLLDWVFFDFEGKRPRKFAVIESQGLTHRFFQIGWSGVHCSVDRSFPWQPGSIVRAPRGWRPAHPGILGSFGFNRIIFGVWHADFRVLPLFFL